MTADVVMFQESTLFILIFRNKSLKDCNESLTASRTELEAEITRCLFTEFLF